MRIEDKIQYNNYKPCDDPNCEARTIDKWSTAGRHLHFIGDVTKPKGHFVSQSGERERNILILAKNIFNRD